MDWKTIESAPKNEAGSFEGPEILVWHKYDGSVRTVFWTFENSPEKIGNYVMSGWFCKASQRFLNTNSVTHWTELPDLPV